MQMTTEILEFICEEMLDDSSIVIEEGTSLFRSKTLDSLNMTMLIVFLETEYKIKINMLDIVYENFDTVNDMVAFVNRKKAARV